MFDAKVIQMLLEGIKDTLYMTIVSTVVGYALGLPLGILLYVPGALLYSSHKALGRSSALVLTQDRVPSFLSQYVTCVRHDTFS